MTSTSRAAADAAPQTASIASLAGDWFSATRSRAKITTELALAEARLAALSVAMMVMLALVAAVFLLGAWGLVVAGIVYGLIKAGVSLWLSLLSLGVVHVAAAMGLWHYALTLSRHLNFPATRQQFRDDDEEQAHVAEATEATG